MQGDLTALIERVEKATQSDNGLDVAIEVALFRPDERHVSARANAAGTKVVYERRAGGKDTYWANSWTLTAEARAKSAALLRALQSQQENSEVKDAG